MQVVSKADKWETLWVALRVSRKADTMEAITVVELVVC